MGIFGWSYPPGAADDPNAPYNQADEQCDVCGKYVDAVNNEECCECEFCPDCDEEESQCICVALEDKFTSDKENKDGDD
jgi:hypothetical protein